MSFLSGIGRRFITIKALGVQVQATKLPKAIAKMSHQEKKKALEQALKRQDELWKEYQKVAAEVDELKLNVSKKKAEEPVSSNSYR